MRTEEEEEEVGFPLRRHPLGPLRSAVECGLWTHLQSSSRRRPREGAKSALLSLASIHPHCPPPLLLPGERVSVNKLFPGPRDLPRKCRRCFTPIASSLVVVVVRADDAAASGVKMVSGVDCEETCEEPARQRTSSRTSTKNLD